MSEWQFTHVSVQVASARYASNVLALLLLPMLCAIGLLGNLLVCMAIWFDRRLHNVTNYFLFSLALADLLVCSIVMPLSLLVEVRHGLWTWSFSVCLLYVYSDVFLCTASIVHMSMISLDRFLGISRPLKTRNQSHTMTAMKIIFVWLITVLISCPIAIAALIDPTNILQRNSCVISNRYYMVYGSTFAFLIPFVVMVVTYVKTTNLLKKQASQLSQRATSRSNGLRRTLPHRRFCQPTILDGTLQKSSANVDTYCSLRTAAPSLLAEDELQLIAMATENKNKEQRGKLRRLRSRTSSAIYALACRLSRRSSLQTTSQELANERKATRVLAVVFGCFFVCWTPFFAANFAVGFCGERCAVPPGVASLFLWLGYVSSTINPLIYTIFNRRFRQAFLRIIRCQCLHPWRTFSGTNFSRNNTCLPGDTYTWPNVERSAALTGVLKMGDYWKNNANSKNRRESPTDRRPLDQTKTTSEARPLLWSKYCGQSTSEDNIERDCAQKRQPEAIHNATLPPHNDYYDDDEAAVTSSDHYKYLTAKKRSHRASTEALTKPGTTTDCCTQTSSSASGIISSLDSLCSCSSQQTQQYSPTTLFPNVIFTGSLRETFL